MIISASRRTDIPAYYAGWFMERIRSGEVEIKNPFNSTWSKKISLHPSEVECLVFWTRNGTPLLPFLPKLNSRGYAYYFMVTLTGYEGDLEPCSPSLASRIRNFWALAAALPSGLVLWRYDPIIFTPKYTADFHKKAFETLCQELHAGTSRCITSFVSFYRKCKASLERMGAFDPEIPVKIALLNELEHIATGFGIQLQTCSSDILLSGSNVKAGACIDARFISQITGKSIAAVKDPHQRPNCLCTKSIDIGWYHSCPAGCIYCYAR